MVKDAIGDKLTNVQAAWDSLDTDGDGKVALSDVNQFITDFVEDVKETLGASDSPCAEKMVAFAEFAQMVKDAIGEKIDAIKEAWASLDVDSDGKVSLTEVNQLIKDKLAEKMGSFDGALSCLDKDGDGQVSFNDLVEMAGGSCLDGLKELWASLDTDGDGKVNLCELKQKLQEVLGDKLNDFKEFMKKLDANGSGRIMPCDFILLLNNAIEDLIDKIKDKFGGDKKPADKPINTSPVPETPDEPTEPSTEPSTEPDVSTEPETPTTPPPTCMDFADEIHYVEEDIPSL
jgi:Ca2+-binding EF-hand superfamily protein